MSANSPDTFRLRLLNQPLVLGAGRDPLALERRDAALLVWCGVAARHEPAAAIWPQVPTAKALASLWQRLFRLRRALGVELVRGKERLQLHPGEGHHLHDEPDDARLQPDVALLSGLDYGDLAGLHEHAGAWRVHAFARRGCDAARQSQRGAGRPGTAC